MGTRESKPKRDTFQDLASYEASESEFKRIKASLLCELNNSIDHHWDGTPRLIILEGANFVKQHNDNKYQLERVAEIDDLLNAIKTIDAQPKF